MDNFTKNILTGIRQWFHSNRSKTDVVLTSHVNKLYSLCASLQDQVTANNRNVLTDIAKINKELSEKLITKTLTQSEYDVSEGDPKTLYIITNPTSASAYLGEHPIYSRIPEYALYFRAEGVESTIAIKITNSTRYEYSTDWYSWKTLHSEQVITLAPYEIVYIRGGAAVNNNVNKTWSQFLMSGKISAHGSISCIGFATNLAYYRLFYNCTSLVAAPMLPATQLSEGCYREMFRGCTSLVTAPVLPATLMTAGNVTLDSCYQNMFSGCSKLKYVKCLLTNVPKNNALSEWLAVVSSTGTFVKAKGVEYPTGGSGIPEGWTVEEVEPESSNENAE